MREMAERKGVSISYLPFAVKACSLAMKEIPILNSSIDTEEMTLTLHASHHIGVAIDSPKGLVVPVIRNCQEMSVLDIAVEMKRLRDLVCKFVLFFLNMCIVKRYVINVFLYLS
jgi:2-oxoisovalerate dehydrogenase E2 component (dihydrolipoyl transacylase)